MRLNRILPLLLALAGCAPGPAPLDDEARTAIASEARTASEALLGALNAHDPDAILAFYDLDGDFTYVACTNFMFGGDGYANLTRSLHLNYTEARYEMAVQSVRVLAPDVAVVSLQGTMLAPLFVTRVLRRSPAGAWLVTWEHESWPGCEGPSAAHPGTTGPDPADEPGA